MVFWGGSRGHKGAAGPDSLSSAGFRGPRVDIMRSISSFLRTGLKKSFCVLCRQPRGLQQRGVGQRGFGRPGARLRHWAGDADQLRQTGTFPRWPSVSERVSVVHDAAWQTLFRSQLLLRDWMMVPVFNRSPALTIFIHTVLLWFEVPSLWSRMKWSPLMSFNHFTEVCSSFWSSWYETCWKKLILTKLYGADENKQPHMWLHEEITVDLLSSCGLLLLPLYSHCWGSHFRSLVFRTSFELFPLLKAKIRRENVLDSLAMNFQLLHF